MVPHWWCPSRRPQNVYPKGSGAYYAQNAASPTDGNIVAARTDYAACVGDQDVVETGAFPANSGSGAPASYTPYVKYAWATDTQGNYVTGAGLPRYTGVCFQRSEVGLRHISDGSSNTYIIGEKYLNPGNYETGLDGGDNETWGTGFNNDIFRCTAEPPLQNRPDEVNATRFGGSHVGGWYAAFCDAHVKLIGYDVDPKVHRDSGNRADGGSTN